MRGIRVLQFESFRSNFQIGGHIKQRDHSLHTLGVSNIAFKNNLIGVRIQAELNVVRRIGRLQLIKHILRLCIFNLKNLDANRSIFGEPGDIDFRTKHRDGLQFVHVAQHVDHDNLFGFNHANLVQSKRLEQQIQGILPCYFFVHDHCDFNGRNLLQTNQNRFARGLNDEGNCVLDFCVFESQLHLVGWTHPTRSANFFGAC